MLHWFLLSIYKDNVFVIGNCAAVRLYANLKPSIALYIVPPDLSSVLAE